MTPTVKIKLADGRIMLGAPDREAWRGPIPKHMHSWRLKEWRSNGKTPVLAGYNHRLKEITLSRAKPHERVFLNMPATDLLTLQVVEVLP